jgi:uncharacterized DUF497 family protein
MRVTYDGCKRASTLAERGLDFEDATHVFAGPNWTAEDRRFAHGETRLQTVGFLAERLVIVVWTPRDDACHVISMRKCNEREQKAYRERFAKGRRS